MADHTRGPIVALHQDRLLQFLLAAEVVGLFFLGSATVVPGVLIGWIIAQLSFNAALAALVAALPDQAASDQRGKLSGLIGITLPIGLVAAAFFAQLFDSAFLMAVVPGSVGVAIALAVAFTLQDRVLSEAPKDSYTFKDFLGSFYFNPVQHPGLGWAWFTKFLVYMAYCCGLL